MWFIALIIILVILAIALISIYNGLIRKRNYIKEAWSSIDVQLKRKSNVLANLVDTIKMQTKYESETLSKIVQMRSALLSANKSEAMQANDTVTKMMPSLFAMSESYPELKSNQSFLSMMEEIKNVEDKIAYSRTRYNKTVTDYNSSIQMFPNSIIAGMFGFKSEVVFEISDVERDYADNLRVSQFDTEK